MKGTKVEYDQDKYPMIWRRTSKKGYFFTARLPCRVVGTSAKRIRVAALMMDGSERYHTVPIEKLIHDPCHCFNACRVIKDLQAKVAE